MYKKQTETITKPKVRLKFIDMARSIAILLMLEGHFIEDSLILEVRDPDNFIYATWRYIRGFTAPVFLTITGLIFVYLLLKNRNQGIFQNIRIKKGFKRVLELFFWGWILQWYAFHILECIAVGIFSILLIYAIYKIIKIIPLWIYFFIAGFLCFAGFLYLRELPKELAWPENSWHFIQNAFHGPKNRAIFPILPWMGYTMFGGMIGALIHHFQKDILKLFFPLTFIIFGVILLFFSNQILGSFDSIIDIFWNSFQYNFIRLNELYQKLGMALIILGFLMIIDKYLGNKINSNNLFLKIGQNTLTIYIIHMMLLYGSVIRVGINDFCHKKLNPWEVTFGAALFVLTFVILIKYIDWIKSKLSFFLNPIKQLFDKIFFIN